MERPLAGDIGVPEQMEFEPASVLLRQGFGGHSFV
jgi:hypothetical protein